MGKEKGKVEKYKARLEQYEKEKEKIAKVFDIDKVLEDAAKIKEAYVEELDMKVRYGPLTVGDLGDVMKAKTDEEKAVVMLYKMLAKADSKVTLEKVKALPIEVATAILGKISAAPFQTLKRLQDGSKRTDTPNYTA